MTLLDPGKFKVSEYRKAIPDWVKVFAAVRLVLLEKTAECAGRAGDIDFIRSLQYDHRPPLNARPFDTESGDFVPPQNDPSHIYAIEKTEHDRRTFGRPPGAERTITTRGSDIGEAGRIKDIQATEAVHRARMASKAGNYRKAGEILAGAPRRAFRRKRKIPSRPFDHGRRPLRRPQKPNGPLDNRW